MLLPLIKGWRTKLVSSTTFNANQAGVGGYSFRDPRTLSNGGNFVRVKFQAAASGANFLTNNCSIGIQSSASATVATPVELKFAGASGFNIAPGATIVSDWLAFTTTAGVVVIVVIDNGATSDIALLASGTEYFKSATASYNVAAPAGFSSEADLSGVATIEVR